MRLRPETDRSRPCGYCGWLEGRPARAAPRPSTRYAVSSRPVPIAFGQSCWRHQTASSDVQSVRVAVGFPHARDILPARHLGQSRQGTRSTSVVNCFLSQRDQRRILVDKVRDLGKPQLGKYVRLPFTWSPIADCRTANGG